MSISVTKNKPFEIDEDDIFKNDKLDRELAIENLSNLIESTHEAFTMSINADWGAGKTTFVKLWQKYLEKYEGIKSIYFSAWEDDFSQEPLISILGEINKYIDTKFENDKPIQGKVDKVKDFGGKVIKRGIPAFANGITGGLLEFDKGVEKALGAMSEEVAKELIDKYAKDKEITQKFKESLEKLLEAINSEKPFVIFIDELDRCRPLYAIELLERIKHIFGIDGLIFVLSIDKKQLSESIKSQYGNIDTDAYLKRFIDLEYNLQNPSVEKFCHFLYHQYEIEATLKQKYITTKYRAGFDHLEMIKYLSISLNLSLREIEQTFIKINIVFKTIEQGFLEVHFRVLVFFIVLKLKNENLYFDLTRQQKSSDKFIDLIVLKNKLPDRLYDMGIVIKAIIYTTSKNYDQLSQIIAEQELILKQIPNSSSSDYKNQKTLINILKIEYGDFKDYMFNDVIQTSIQKIEFLDRFTV